eukprot:gene2149-2344_t
MSFRFNFSLVNDSSIVETAQEEHSEMDLPDIVEVTASLRAVPRPTIATIEGYSARNLPVGPRTLRIISSDTEATAEGLVSDLIPGVYGGGKVVWECSVDLALYLFHHHSALGLSSDSRILELGCGHGLPGIAMLLNGYEHVTFTDLNNDVIEDFTWPNILLNCPALLNCCDRDRSDDGDNKIQCFSGDWKALSEELGGKTFDLILSAETLYSPQTCREVAMFLGNHLSPTGCALLATKRFYFGVGGGSHELEDAIANQKLDFRVELVATFEDGQSNIRDLLSVKKG